MPSLLDINLGKDNGPWTSPSPWGMLQKNRSEKKFPVDFAVNGHALVAEQEADPEGRLQSGGPLETISFFKKPASRELNPLAARPPETSQETISLGLVIPGR